MNQPNWDKQPNSFLWFLKPPVPWLQLLDGKGAAALFIIGVIASGLVLDRSLQTGTWYLPVLWLTFFYLVGAALYKQILLGVKPESTGRDQAIAVYVVCFICSLIGSVGTIVTFILLKPFG